MTYAPVTLLRQMGAGTGSLRLARLVKAGIGAVDRWAERSRVRRALRELDDRTLHDIGASRASLDAEAAKPFWRA